MCFKSDSGKLSLNLTGKLTDIIPAVVLLQRQNFKDDHYGFHAKLDGVSLGKLPLLAIVEPGNHRFRLNMTSGEFEEESIYTKSDYIRKLFFEMKYYSMIERISHQSQREIIGQIEGSM